MFEISIGDLNDAMRRDPVAIFFTVFFGDANWVVLSGDADWEAFFGDGVGADCGRPGAFFGDAVIARTYPVNPRCNFEFQAT